MVGFDTHGPKTDKPVTEEVAVSENGRDITIGFMGALREVQDTVLKRLGNNYKAYQELRRDDQVHACFQQRRLALTGRPLVIEPGGDDAASIAAADFLRENLTQIPFDRTCSMAMWGVLYGYSAVECMWEAKDGGWRLAKPKVRTAWRFRFSPQGELRLLTQKDTFQIRLLGASVDEPPPWASWSPGLYDAQLRLLRQDGSVKVKAIGVVPVIKGLSQRLAANVGGPLPGAGINVGTKVVIQDNNSFRVINAGGTTGRSAYQVAAGNGFEGTEAEYAARPLDAADAADQVREATDAVRIATLQAKGEAEAASEAAAEKTDEAEVVRAATDAVRLATDQVREDTLAVKVQALAVVDAGAVILDAVPLAEAARAGAEAAAADVHTIISRGERADDGLRLKDPKGFVFLEITPETFDHPEFSAVKADVAKANNLREVVTPRSYDDRFRCIDYQKNIFFEVTPTRIKHVEIDAIKASIAAIGAIAEAVSVPAKDDRLRAVDAAKNIFFDVTPEHLKHVEFNAVKAQASATAEKVTQLSRAIRSVSVDPTGALYRIKALLAHIIIYGQSLGIGVDGGPALSTVADLLFAKMFSGGMRSRDAVSGTDNYNAAFYASLTGLKEATQVTGGYGEVGAYAIAEMIAYLLLTEDGIDLAAMGQQLLFSAPGEGSQPIANLKNGGTYWSRLQHDIDNGKALAAGVGPYLLSAMVYRQGEADTSLETNPAAWKLTLKNDVVGAARAYNATVTGADTPLPCVVYQMANHRLYGKDPTIALALLELAMEEDNFFLSAPLYPMSHHLDGSHPVNVGYRRLGGFEGIALKRLLFDGVRPKFLKPLTPVWVDGAVIVPFDVPVGRLTPDTTLVSNPGSYGFTLLDNAGTARTIDSVTPLGTDRVVLRYSGAALTTGAKVWYARGADLTRSGPVIGPRGNLRDQQGDALTFHGDPMHNWSPIFCKTKG